MRCRLLSLLLLGSVPATAQPRKPFARIAPLREVPPKNLPLGKPQVQTAAERPEVPRPKLPEDEAIRRVFGAKLSPDASYVRSADRPAWLNKPAAPREAPNKATIGLAFDFWGARGIKIKIPF